MPENKDIMSQFPSPIHRILQYQSYKHQTFASIGRWRTIRRCYTAPWEISTGYRFLIEFYRLMWSGAAKQNRARTLIYATWGRAALARSLIRCCSRPSQHPLIYEILAASQEHLDLWNISTARPREHACAPAYHRRLHASQTQTRSRLSSNKTRFSHEISAK